MSEPAALPPDLPRKGDLLAGKYLVEDVVGVGGMGVVVAARHQALRQRVAVKFLLPQAARLPEASTRFLREARASVSIQSEHVARVLDVGTLETGAPYMVMEYLAGTDFSRLLKQRGPLPVDDAVDFLLQACEAIAEAHLLGIVHRDLKPGNLFLTTRAEGSPLVKVLDFGLSKMTLPEDEAGEGSLTSTSIVAGSPQYMSPEQIRSLKQVGTGTDIWALGVILYEMLTARRPFEGRTLTAVSASIAADSPIRIQSLRPEVPAGLDDVVLGCLEKDLTRRWPTVAHLAARLAPFAPARSAPLLERIVKLATLSRPDRSAVVDEPTTDMGRPSGGPGVFLGAVPAPGSEGAPRAPAPSQAVMATPIPGSAPLAQPFAAGVPPADPVADAWGQTTRHRKHILPAAFAGGAIMGLGILALIGWAVLGGGDDTRGTAVAGAASSPAVLAPLAPPPATLPAPSVAPAAEARPLAPADPAPEAAASALASAVVTARPASSSRLGPPLRPVRRNLLDRSD